MKNENKVRILAFAGVLIAMNIVLARLVAINIGPTLRITVSQTPIFLAGFWFGPVVGGICGFLGDLIGSLLQGYAPNPFISVSAILAGVLPGLLRHILLKKTDLWRFLVIIGLQGVIGSLGFTCLGLHIYYGTPWSVLYASRLVQTPLLVVVNSVLVFILYRSPLTAYVKKSASAGIQSRARAGAEGKR